MGLKDRYPHSMSPTHKILLKKGNIYKRGPNLNSSKSRKTIMSNRYINAHPLCLSFCKVSLMANC